MSDLDEIARLVHPEAEQGREAARRWAEQIVAYYRTLRTGGLSVEPATYLTRDYQAIVLHHSLARFHGEGGA